MSEARNGRAMIPRPAHVLQRSGSVEVELNVGLGLYESSGDCTSHRLSPVGCRASDARSGVSVHRHRPLGAATVALHRVGVPRGQRTVDLRRTRHSVASVGGAHVSRPLAAGQVSRSPPHSRQRHARTRALITSASASGEPSVTMTVVGSAKRRSDIASLRSDTWNLALHRLACLSARLSARLRGVPNEPIDLPA